mgnify:CR=1 FL=1
MTREYLDQTLDHKLGKALAEQTRELKDFTEQQVENLAIMIQHSVVEPFANRMDSMDQRFDQMDQRFDGIDQRFDQMDLRLDGMDQRFDQVDERLIKIDGKFEKLENALSVKL